MIGPFASWEAVFTLVALLALAYMAAVWLSLVVWTARDVRQRTADDNQRLAAVLFVAVFSVPGWLAYLLLRPSRTLDDARIDVLQEQLFARELATVGSCSRCRRRVAEDFLVCPYCRERLRVSCPSCARAVSRMWDACAYCGEQLARRAVPALERQTAPSHRAAPASSRPLMPREAR